VLFRIIFFRRKNIFKKSIGFFSSKIFFGKKSLYFVDQALNDFLNKSNTTSYIFVNGRYISEEFVLNMKT